jgi:hypothetical protein
VLPYGLLYQANRSSASPQRQGVVEAGASISDRYFKKLHGCRRIRPTLARPFRLSGMVVVLGGHDGLLLLTTYPYVNPRHRKK